MQSPLNVVADASAPARWRWTLAWTVPALPLLGAWLYATGGGALALWIGPLVLYGLVPLLDRWLGSDPANPAPAAISGLAADRFYRRILYVWLLLHYGALLFAAGWLAQHSPSLVGWLGWAATVGLVSGGGINVAHELGHQRSRLDRGLAKLALAPAFYGHFAVEHNRGHHVRVATPEDPASARLGESFWRFLPRTLIGSLRSAWRLEAERLAARGSGVCHWRNENLQGWALSLLLLTGISLAWGAEVGVWLLVQGLIGATTLEAVNYIEHYGLLRQRGADGRYERCQPQHSWNSNQRLTNLLLFQLERHSDHHAHPTRPYQTLRHFSQAPQLPAGYAGLVPLVYLPRLWFWLMDQRVLAFYSGDRSRCNLGLAGPNVLR